MCFDTKNLNRLFRHLLQALLSLAVAVKCRFEAGAIKLQDSPVTSTRTSPVRPSLSGTSRSGQRRMTLMLLAVSLVLSSPAWAIDILNTASVEGTLGASTTTFNSNTVTVAASPLPTVATAEFLRHSTDPAGALLPTTRFSNADPPGTFNPVLPPPGPGILTVATDYFEGEMAVIRITDPDQDIDPFAPDTILVRLDVAATGDNELLRLTETGNATGIFEGYIYSGTAATTPYNGYLTALATNQINLDYDDGGTALTITNPVMAPLVNANLWLQLDADRTAVAAGDIFTYTLNIENVDAVTATSVTVTQYLPFGFRYQPGSTHINGMPSPDPAVSADGITLTFNVGDIPAANTSTIDIRVMVGAVTSGRYPSDATAQAISGQTSNNADYTVIVRDELGTGKSFIAGRVLAGCGNSYGVEGVRIFLEDGTFIVTDSRGRYHIEGVEPGTHVVQLDPITLPDGYEPAPCEETTRFAGNPSSRFVELEPGALWRADFYISDKPINGEVSIALNNTYAIGSAATYTVSLAGKDVQANNQRLQVTLPPEAEYLPGSSIIDNHALADPEIEDQTLTYILPDRSDQWESTITLRTYIDDNLETGEMQAKARLHFDTPVNTGLVTPDAESTLIWISRGERAEVQELLLRPHFDTLDAKLTEKDLDQLDKVIEQISALELIKVYVIGHTDARRIRWKDGVQYKDNFELSNARAQAVAQALLDALDLEPQQVVSVGMAAAVPIAENKSVEGLAMNRRTELKVLHRIVINPEMEKIGANGGRVKTLQAPNKVEPPSTPDNDAPLGILSPQADHNLAQTIEQVRIRLDARLTPKLFLDDVEIPNDRIGFKMPEDELGTRIYSFVGVDFGTPGQHQLKLQGIGPFGNSRFEQEISIYRTDEIARIEVVEADGNIADGRTPVKIRVELFDQYGEMIPSGAKLEVRSGELVPINIERTRLPRAPETKLLHVDNNGIATFEPVSGSGVYRVTLGFNKAEVEAEILIKPEARDWILVGIGEGTVGYNEISGNIQPLDPNKPEEAYYDEGRVAFFAKGQIKGDWLLTMAYDSDKEDLKDRSLHQVIDPGTYYTVYGDTTQQGYEAASAEKLYVRIERNRFYGVFGDINTGLNVTELSRYNRSLTGIQSEFNGKNFGYTAFASETAQGFVRDEIQGDGTSGLYRLTQNDIVINSEKITLETRDRFHSEQILESRFLQRHLDYDIDYNDGTIYFKEPIQSRDQDFNPIFITVDYESTAQGAEDYTYGGRAYSRFNNGNIEFGASLIHEGHNALESDLTGVDTKLKLTDTLTLSGEWATSETVTTTGKTNGDAWLAEIEHRSRLLDANLYLREQESNFGLGQQNASETGTRKFGGNLAYRLTQELEIGTEVFQQENLSTGLKRQVEEVNARYNSMRYTLLAGLRHAEDDPTAGQTETSDQIILGAEFHASDKLNLRLRHEQSFGNNENQDYPTRTLIGADYKLNRAVSLFAEEEITSGDSADTASTRVGLNATPWDGGQIRTSMEQNLSESGQRIFGNLGLLQNWQVNPKLSLSFSVDRSQLLSGQNNGSFHPDQPPASGSSEDFSAYSTGLSYRELNWTFDSRVEYRTSDSEDRWGIFAGSIVEPETFLGLSLHGSYFTTDRSDQSRSTDAELSFGLAYRPDDSSWIILNRLDLVTAENETLTTRSSHWKIVERLNAFWRASKKNRLTFKLGTRYAADDFETTDYSGMTYLLGSEWRHDLSNRTDVGLHGSILQVQELSQALYHSGFSFGYSPLKNFWASVGYNFNGFQDDDFSQADYTAQGPYVKFRFKFDQNSIKDGLKWLNTL